jgi:hypothetical protein
LKIAGPYFEIFKYSFIQVGQEGFTIGKSSMKSRFSELDEIKVFGKRCVKYFQFIGIRDSKVIHPLCWISSV